MNKPISLSIEQQALKVITALVHSQPLIHHEWTRSCVLCYHSVSDRHGDGATSPREFERQLSFLVRERRILPLTDLLNRKGKGEGAVAITFDDGYEDTFTTALPIMKSYGATATVFVLGNPEAADRKQLDNANRLMSISKIRRLIDCGWEIGFHSATHADLSVIRAGKLEEEIAGGKERLQRRLKYPLRYFAYPNGQYSQAVVDAVKRAGFAAAFTTNGGPLNPGEDPYRLGRIIITKHHTVEDLKLLLTDSGLVINRMVGSLIRSKDHLTSKAELALGRRQP